jgi:hypothetical protein
MLRRPASVGARLMYRSRGARLEGLAYGVDRHRRRDLTGGVAAHAVRDDEEAVGRLHVGRVFVVLAYDPDVGNEPGFERHARGFV